MDGAATVVPDNNPRRPWKPKLLMPTLLNLSKGAVVAVDTDVAESAVMDGAATVAHVLKRRLKLLSPNNVADVGTVAAVATLMGSAVFVVPRRWLLKKRRKRKKLSHEWCVAQTLCLYFVCMDAWYILLFRTYVKIREK